MKKILLSVWIISMVAVTVYAQNLSLSNAGGAIAPNATLIQTGTYDSVGLATSLNVKNTGTERIGVLCKKTELTMLNSTEISMCWAGQCYGPEVYISPEDQQIGAGETNTQFVAHYNQVEFNHLPAGESVVRWVFYDRGNVNDSVSVTVRYITYGLGVGEQITADGMLSNIYPNPASGNAGLSYTVPSGMQGMIRFRNILGESVKTIILPPGTDKLTIDTREFSDGIYFYSLVVDGKVTRTKKLIVRH